jgi:hypothetical protein
MTKQTVPGYVDPFGRWDPKLTPRQILDSQKTGDKNNLLFELTLRSIESFLGMRIDCLNEEIISRYAKASPLDLAMPVIPYDKLLWKKIISPLREAKKSYALGEYISTIALSGMIAEMLALLTFQLHGPFRSPEDKDISFEKFEKLGQERRITILEQKLAEKPIQLFNNIKNTRRRYLHLWSQEETRSGFTSLHK